MLIDTFKKNIFFEAVTKSTNTRDFYHLPHVPPWESLLCRCPTSGKMGVRISRFFCCSLKLETDQKLTKSGKEYGKVRMNSEGPSNFWGTSENKPPDTKDLCTSLHISERSQLSFKAMLPYDGAPAGGAVTMVARRLQCLLGTYAPQVICDPWCDRVTSMQHDSHHLSGPFQNPKPYCNSHDIKYCT